MSENFYITGLLEQDTLETTENKILDTIDLSQSKTVSRQNTLKGILNLKKTQARKGAKFVSLNDPSSNQSPNQSIVGKSKIVDDSKNPHARRSSLRKLSDVVSRSNRRTSVDPTERLFQQGIFEESSAAKFTQSFYIPQKPDPTQTPSSSPKGHKYISTKPAKQKPRTYVETDSYFNEKERLLRKLGRNDSNKRWDLQTHLAKIMQENNDLNRRALKQTKVTSVGYAPRSKSACKSRSQIQKGTARDILDLSKNTTREVQENDNYPCLVFHLPKKYSSITGLEAVKVVPKSQIQSQRSTVFEFKEVPPTSFLNNITKVQEKLNGWKKPYTILNKRLKRRFVRSQLESLNASLDQP